MNSGAVQNGSALVGLPTYAIGTDNESARLGPEVPGSAARPRCGPWPNACRQFRRTVITYQVVTGVPTGNVHPATDRTATIGLPIALPAPSSAATETPRAPAMLRS